MIYKQGDVVKLNSLGLERTRGTLLGDIAKKEKIIVQTPDTKSGFYWLGVKGYIPFILHCSNFEKAETKKRNLPDWF